MMPLLAKCLRLCAKQLCKHSCGKQSDTHSMNAHLAIEGVHSVETGPGSAHATLPLPCSDVANCKCCYVSGRLPCKLVALGCTPAMHVQLCVAATSSSVSQQTLDAAVSHCRHVAILLAKDLHLAVLPRCLKAI